MLLKLVPSYYLNPKTITCGDVDSAFKQADHVIEGESHMGGQKHFCLETNACLAVPKGEDGEMELFVSTQNANETQVGFLMEDPKVVEFESWLWLRWNFMPFYNPHNEIKF